ncbi:tripartite tricarboxylate transporter TctB family protein [Fusobacterium sp. IOR10]|uniref:tripartite tricarboxylate transporter TctB family protein n=1 Tax=Fusobacterium sp. IOR10 TaxID=2665157 RepID=UPI0013D04369|nr:tripartite tricarboxylate transporter TctB family protein [Fusobacterium sp. IOR10]
MRIENKKIAMVLGVYILSIMFFIQSFQMIKDSGLFPRFISGIIIFLNTLYLLEIYRGKDESKKNKKDEIVYKKLYVMIFLSAVYILVVPFLGYFISTIIYMVISMNSLGVKNKKTIVLVSIGSALVIYLCFSILLKVHIPVSFLGI